MPKIVHIKLFYTKSIITI